MEDRLGERSGWRAQRPDGQQLRWKSSDLASDSTRVSSLPHPGRSDRALRVPGGKETDHPNGVRGITGVTILTDDLESARAAYGKLFAGPVAALDHGFEGEQQSWRFTCGQDWIDLLQPPDAESSLVRYLAAWGSGIYQISLTVGSGPEFPERRIDIAGFPDLHVLVTN